MFRSCRFRSRRPALDQPTLRHVIAVIDDRMRELDRRGPPNAPGYGCSACRDAELHRLVAVLKERATR